MPFLGILVGVIHLHRPRNLRLAITAPAMMALFTLTGMSPNAIRHYCLSGKFIPLGINGEINFHMANNTEGWGWWKNSPGLEYDIYRDTPFLVDTSSHNVDFARAYWSTENQKYLTGHWDHFV